MEEIATNAPGVGDVSVESRNGAPSGKACVVNGQTAEASKQMSTPPTPPATVAVVAVTFVG